MTDHYEEKLQRDYIRRMRIYKNTPTQENHDKMYVAGALLQSYRQKMKATKEMGMK